ncbi:DUF7373 family lipoprotein [Nocardia sp. CA-129566]|uniref:DUF7373 family lipoprotein n=1 Tax=Nocardia sp. CA-129566 TaxID=3239976 RepID=UPI003D981E7E
MVRTSRIAFAVACIALAGVLAGCSGVQGTPLAAEQDVRKLEVGTYPVDRHRYNQDAGSHGALLEGMRMSEAVVATTKIDPSLTYGREGKVLSSIDDAVEHVASASKPVLVNRNYLTGYATSGSDKPDPAGQTRPSTDTTAVTNVVFRFPDEATAKIAARELEDADINISPDNRKLPSSKYPDAYIHWRPGIPNIGTFMAHKEFVISLFVGRPRADGADLLSWVEKTLDAQVPALDKFQATPKDQFNSLKVDPENMLARVVVADRRGHTPNADNFAVYGPSYFVQSAEDETKTQQLVDEVGVEKFAIVDNGSVTRVRDYPAGQKFIDGLMTEVRDTFEPIDAPKDVPGAKCLQLNSKGDPERQYKYRCYVGYKRYVGVVTSDKEPDVRQKVTAQYALFANSL